jgi:hypothetical protein
MILQLGQPWLTGSKPIVPSASREGKGFIRAFGEYLLTNGAHGPFRRQASSSIVTEVMATGWSGRSRALRGALAIWSTTSRPLVTSPKIV